MPPELLAQLAQAFYQHKRYAALFARLAQLLGCHDFAPEEREPPRLEDFCAALTEQWWAASPSARAELVAGLQALCNEAFMADCRNHSL